jgi:hypothetical protein
MIQIFTTGPGCSRCNLLKEALWRADIAYEEKPLDATILAGCLCETDVWVQAAPLVLDGHVWHFADDFFDSSGNLLPGWLENMKGIKPHKAGFTGTGGNPSEKKQKCGRIWKGDL